MAIRNYTNGSSMLALGNALDDSETTISVASTFGTPSAPFTIVLERATPNEEVCLVTGKTPTDFVVTRGWDGSTPVAHDEGVPIEHSSAAIDFQEANDHLNSTSDDVHSQYIPESIFANLGDIVFASGAASPVVLPLGEANTILVADSGETLGAKWTKLGTSHFPNSVIGQSALATNSVTNAKLANSAVTTDTIANSAITTAKLDDGAISGSAFANGAITADKVASGAVTAAKVSDGSVTAGDFANGSITNNEIANASGSFTNGVNWRRLGEMVVIFTTGSGNGWDLSSVTIPDGYRPPTFVRVPAVIEKSGIPATAPGVVAIGTNGVLQLVGQTYAGQESAHFFFCYVTSNPGTF